MADTEWVRIRVENGMEVSVNRDYVPDGAEVLDEPATNLRGIPRPASRKAGRPVKPRTSVDVEAAKKSDTKK